MASQSVRLETRDVRAAGDCLQLALQAAASNEQQRRSLTRQALADQLVQQLDEEMEAAEDPWSCLTACCMAFQVCESQREEEYRCGWWLEGGRTPAEITAAIHRHVCTHGKWLGDPILKLGANALRRPVVVFKHVANRGARQAAIEPLVVLPQCGDDCDHALVDVTATIYRAGGAAPIATFTAKNAAWPDGPAPLYLLLEARMDRGREMGHHYSNLVERAAATGSRRPRRSAAPSSFEGMDDDGCDGGSTEDEPGPGLGSSDSDSSDDEPALSSDSDVAAPASGASQRKRPAAKAPRAKKKDSGKKRKQSPGGKLRSPAEGKQRKQPTSGKRKQPDSSASGSAEAEAKDAPRGGAGRMEQRVYVWQAPGLPCCRYVATLHVEPADLEPPEGDSRARHLGLCWLLAPSRGPQLVMARLFSGRAVKAPGALDVPTALPHRSTLAIKTANLLQLPAGTTAEVRAALPARPVLAVLRHAQEDEQRGGRPKGKQDERFIKDARTFTEVNASMLQAVADAYREELRNAAELFYEDGERDCPDHVTPEQAKAGAEELERDRCRPEDAGDDPYFKNIFDRACELVQEACDAAKHLEEEHQPQEVLRGLSACAARLPDQVRTNVMGTAMELTQQAALLLKKEFFYTRGDKKAGVSPRVGQYMFVRVPKAHLGADAEARVVPPEDVLEDDPDHDYKPCSFISRAAPAIKVRMTDRDMWAVARAFAPGADDRQQAAFVELLKEVMQKDVGWDILTVVRDKERTDELHMVWIQVKYRSDFRIPTDMLYAYLGKYYGLCERQQQRLGSELPYLDTSRNHFMWSSNQYRAGRAKAEFPKALFYTMPNFEEDWGQHGFLEGLPQVVRQLVSADTTWRDVTVGSAPPSTALEEQAQALERLASNLGDPELPRGNVLQAPTGSGKTLMAQHFALLAPIAAAAAAVGSPEELELTRRLYRSTLDALRSLHDQRTAAHRRAVHDAYHRMVAAALVPVAMFAPFIHLCRQNLIAFFTQYHRWRRYLATKPEEGLELPDLRFMLVCSDTEPVGDTGDIECCTCSELPDVLTRMQQSGGTQHVVMFTTIQGSHAFHARGRSFVLEHGYAYGSTPGGRLFRDDSNGTQRPALIGTVIIDEAHKACGQLGRLSTRPVSVALDLACHSLSLTATPLVLKARRDALMKAQLRVLLKRAAQRQAARQPQQRQQVEEPCATDSPDDEATNNSQDPGRRAKGRGGNHEDDSSNEDNSDDELEEDLCRDARDADVDPERADADEARRFLDYCTGEVCPQVDDAVRYATEDGPDAAPAAAICPEPRFAANGRMHLCPDAEEFWSRSGIESPPAGLDPLTANLDDLASALCKQKNRCVAVVQASTYSQRGDWAYPLMHEADEQDSLPQLPGGVIKRNLVWKYVLMKTAAPDPPAEAEPEDDEREDAANNNKRRRKAEKPRQGVLDADFCKNGLIVGVVEDGGARRRLALFPYEWTEVGHADFSPPVGAAVHDQSGIFLRSLPQQPQQEECRRPVYNFNGHGPIAHTISWADAMRWRDRMPGVTDTSTVLPNRAPHESFVPYEVSTLDSMSERRHPPPQPKDSPAYLAGAVRRLFLRTHQAVDEAKFDVASAQDAERGGKLWREEEDVLTDSDWTDLAEVQLKFERAVRKGDGRCRLLWVRCEPHGADQPNKYRIAEGGVPEALMGVASLEHVLPLGYCVDEGTKLVRVLFPTGAPRRRRPLVLKPALVLMNQPYLPYDGFAMDDFARNLLGVARQPGSRRQAIDLEEAEAELRDLHAAVPFLRRALAEAGHEGGSARRRRGGGSNKDRDAAWADRALERALELAKQARVQFHTDKQALDLPDVEKQRMDAAFDHAQNAVVKLRDVIAEKGAHEKAELLRVLREEAAAGGSEKPRDATVAQPQQVKYRIRIGRTVFPCTLQHVLTAQMIVTAVTAPEPFRRKKLVVFARCNVEAVLLQMLFRAILDHRHPEVAKQMYDAHVFSTMSLGSKSDAPVTQAMERNQQMLRAFARAELAVLFAANYLQEGWDCPSVDGCLIAYACKSIRDVVQMCGRMMRFDNRNPDKTCALFVPVHDQACVTVQEFSEERVRAVDALGEMVPAAAADDAGIELPFTPYQQGYDVIRKLLECMLDESVRVISRAFTLSHTRPCATAGGYCEGPAVKAGAVTGEKLLEILMLRAAEKGGNTEFMPIPVMCEQQVTALLDAAARLKLVRPARHTHDQVISAWRQSRRDNLYPPDRRPPREARVDGYPLGQKLDLIVRQARGYNGGSGLASCAAQKQALELVQLCWQEFGVDLLHTPLDMRTLSWEDQVTGGKTTLEDQFNSRVTLTSATGQRGKPRWNIPGREALFQGSEGVCLAYWFEQSYGQPVCVACMADERKKALLEADFAVEVRNRKSRTDRVYTHVPTGQRLENLDLACRWHFAWTAGPRVWMRGPEEATRRDSEAWGPVRNIQTVAFNHVELALIDDYNVEQSKGGSTKYRLKRQLPCTGARQPKALSEGEARLEIFTRPYKDAARKKLCLSSGEGDSEAEANAQAECAVGDGSKFSSAIVQALSGIAFHARGYFKSALDQVLERHFDIVKGSHCWRVTPKVPDPEVPKPFTKKVDAYKYLVQRWAAGQVQESWLMQYATQLATGHVTPIAAVLCELKLKVVKAHQDLANTKYVHEPTGKALTGIVTACAFALALEQNEEAKAVVAKLKEAEHLRTFAAW